MKQMRHATAKFIVLTFLTVGILGLFGCDSGIPPGVGPVQVEGKVRLVGGDGSPDKIEVTLTSKTTDRKVTTTTDSDGNFEFKKDAEKPVLGPVTYNIGLDNVPEDYTWPSDAKDQDHRVSSTGGQIPTIVLHSTGITAPDAPTWPEKQ